MFNFINTFCTFNLISNTICTFNLINNTICTFNFVNNANCLFHFITEQSIMSYNFFPLRTAVSLLICKYLLTINGKFKQ
jgi:hypothetical protein